MLFRTVTLLALVAALPAHALAAQYTVRPGDSLSVIAHRYGVSVGTLARANGIINLNLVRIGQTLTIPSVRRAATTTRSIYRVRWGDSLSLIAARHHTTVAVLRALNPRLGQVLLAGQLLVIPGSSAFGGTTTVTRTAASRRYTVRPGDTLSGIAASYGVSVAAVLAANRLVNPNHIVIGTTLVIPGGGSYSSSYSYVYNPAATRALIVRYAGIYGLLPALPLAIAWEESGFNQSVVSGTGAVGVMQVEPYTADHISWLLGRHFDIHQIDDNVHAGVFWIATLLRYYGWNERLAVAAYYQGSKSLARIGMYEDTKQYVANVMALKRYFGG